MTVAPQNPLSYLGVTAPNPPTTIVSSIAPLSGLGGNYQYPIGTLWINSTIGSEACYQLASVLGTTATWIVLGGGSSDVNTINGLSPTGGNINIVGTAAQIAVANLGSTITLSIPAVASNTTSFTSGSFITSSATLGTTFTANSLTPTGSNANIDLLVNGKGTGGVIQSRGLVAGDLTIEVTNTDNTNAASRAGFEAAVGGATAGDPYINFLVSGAGSFTMGIDNSVSDNFVISTGTALGTTDNIRLVSTGALSVLRGDLDVTRSQVGNVIATVANTSVANATDGSIVNISSGSGAAGDAQTSYIVTGVTTWSAGVDNSATDNFVIAASATLGTSNAVSLTTAGAMNVTTSVTAGTTLTATLGDISATNGNLVLGTSGNKIASTSVATTIAAGANSFGSVTLVGGTATVSTTAVTANSLIVIWRQSIGATGANPVGLLYVGPIVAATSFEIHAGLSTSVTTDVATDVSVVGWMIIN